MIDAAIKVVAKRGFDGAPVAEIARAAGFSIGALYGNFAGKDDLFLAVYDAHVTWFEQELAGLDLADPAGALAGAFARLDEQAARAQFLVFIEFWSYAVRRPKLRRELARRMTALRATAARRLEERGAPLPLPAETLALLLLATWRGLALERMADAGAVDDAEVGRLLGAALG
jgi:AcrR family transcriptional regulator